MQIYDVLADPESGQKLVSGKDGLLNGLNTQLYDGKVINGIPCVFPRSFRGDEPNDDALNYLEHYQKDAEYFDYFKPYTCAFTNSEVNWLHRKIDSHIPKNAKLILDIGCGNGWVSQKYVSDVVSVISADIALINVERALKNKQHINHSGLVADVFNLPIQKDSIDCIIASEIIEHVPDPKLFIQKLFKVLKPGGTLVITTPYNETLVYHQCVHCNKLTPENAHIHSFHENDLPGLVPVDANNWAFEKFGNKYMHRIGAYHYLKSLPLGLWKSLDNITNKMIKKPKSLLIKIEK